MTGVTCMMAGTGGGGYRLTSGTISLYEYGYTSSPAVGSLTPSTGSPYGASVNILQLSSVVYPGSENTKLFISGNRSGGWTALYIDGVQLTYASATRTYNSGSDYTSWVWTGDYVPTSGTSSVRFG